MLFSGFAELTIIVSLREYFEKCAYRLKSATRQIVVYSFQTLFVLAVGEPFMAPVGQYVFAEIWKQIGTMYRREP